MSSSELDVLSSQIAALSDRLDAVANRSPWFSATVVSTNALDGELTIEDASGTLHTVTAVLGYVPDVGVPVICAMNGSDAIVIPPPFTLVPGNALRSTNFVHMLDGWQISAEGDVEFNDALFRGEIVASQATFGEGDNWLANPGFEVNTTGWTASGATVARVTSGMRTGAGAGELTATGTSDFTLTSPTGTSGMPVNEGETVVARGFIKATTQSDAFHVSVLTYDLNGDFIAEDVGETYLVTNFQYYGIVVSIIVPAGVAFVAIRVTCEANAISVGDKWLIDDLFLGTASSIVSARFKTAEDGPRTEITHQRIELYGGGDGLNPIRIEAIGNAGGFEDAEFEVGGSLYITGGTGVTVAGGDEGVTFDMLDTGKFRDGDARELFPWGMPFPWLGPFHTMPDGWLSVVGSSLLRADSPRLFNAWTADLGPCTITIASPGVITLNSHFLVDGDAVFLTTTGALPTGLSANTTYYVKNRTSNTFQLSATRDGSGVPGTAINTSGTQSGVHTLIAAPFGVADSTHFYMPDMRGATLAGLDSMGFSADGGYLSLPSVVGLRFGEQNHVITGAESDAHSHTTTFAGSGYWFGTTGANLAAAGANFGFNLDTSQGTNSQGSGGSHNTMQPSMLVHWIVLDG